MNRFLSFMFTLVVGACASEWELPEEEDLLASGPQVFVLDIVNYERQDTVFTFDHICDGVHRQSTVRDTITLSPDGTARRGTYVEHLADGQVDSTSYVPASGIWVSSMAIVTPGALLNLYLTPVSGEYVMPLVVTGPRTLSRRSPVGGTCSGSNNDSRTVEFMYTKR